MLARPLARRLRGGTVEVMADIVEVLRRSPLLGEMGEPALVHLASEATRVALAPGDVLMCEGEPADAAYVVLEGLLEVTKRDGDADLLLDYCRPGDPVGELGLVDRRPRSATVRAVEPCRLLRIDAETFEDLLRAPGVARQLLAATTRRLEQREAVMRQHARMATLGSLTAGLLHEVNNPAAAVRRASEQLSDAVGDFTAATGQLDPAALAAVRDIVERLRATAEARSRQPAYDVEEALAESLERSGVAPPWQLAGRLAAAGVTAHDLGDLRAATGERHAAATARALAGSLEIPSLASILREATSRISEVVDAVKGYSHHDRAPVQQVAVNEGLEQALTLLGHRLGPDVRVVIDLGEDLPAIEGYPGELNSVWTNLLDNALDAVAGHGEIRLCTRAEADRVVVEIADDGSGIPEEIAERVFDPFFTTKPVGEGTGLGLAIAHTVVTQVHGGQLAFTSRPGRTVFRVRLPWRLPANRS